ncbi:MAG: exonuclease domain-containing protein [Pseudomonadota bacterium]
MNLIRFVTVDVETANEDVSSICQIGVAAVMSNGTIETVGSFIDPRVDFSPMNISVHGITAETVQGAPPFDEAINTLRPLIYGFPLFQHSNSNFDQRAIDAARDKHAMPAQPADWRSSWQVARLAWPERTGAEGHSLKSLKAFLGLEFDHHDAIEDARAAAQVILRAEAHTGKDFERILKGGRPKKGFDRFVAVLGDKNGQLYGETACFTGALSINRQAAAERAAKLGITCKGSVTKKTTLLIVGDQDLAHTGGHLKSSKHRKAEELIADGQSIRIFGESEFMALLAAHDA